MSCNHDDGEPARGFNPDRFTTQAEWDAQEAALASALAAGRTQAQAERNEEARPRTFLEHLWAMTVGCALLSISGWPIVLASWLNTADRYADLSGNAINLGLNAWAFWFLLTLLAGVAVLFSARVGRRNGERIMLAFIIGSVLGAMGMVLLTRDGDPKSELNRLCSTYLYTMRVTLIPSNDPYYGQYRTLHAEAPVIAYSANEEDKAIGDPCVDVYLGMLGGYWAAQPYSCGSRPGKRMANAADLAPVVPAGWNWGN